MVTDVVKTIGTGGDYTTVLDFLISTAGDLVSSGVRIIGELIENKIYDEDGLVFVGATTDEEHYRMIRSAASVRGRGFVNSGPRLYSDDGGYAAVVAFEENYARIEDVELYSDGDGIMYGVFGNSSASGYQCNRVIVHDCTYGGFVYEGSGTFDNCVAHHCGVLDGYYGGFAGLSAKPNEVRARHCIAFRNDDEDTIQVTAFRYLNVQNCAAFNYGGDDGHQCYLNLGTSSAKYASSDNTGSEAALTGLSAGDIFRNLTSGSVDLRFINNNTVLNDAGSGIADVGSDMVLVTRDASTPDIGAFEWVALTESISYLHQGIDQLPMSGIYDYSQAELLTLPSGESPPAIQARLISDTLTTLDGQVIFLAESGNLMVASGNSSWVGLLFS